MAISAASLLIAGQGKLILLYAWIVVQLLLMIRLNDKARAFPVHRRHLIERIGLFAIIVLDGTIIGIVASVVACDQYDRFDADRSDGRIPGHIVQIWWIYFGALYLLERAKRIQSGLWSWSHTCFCTWAYFHGQSDGPCDQRRLNPETFAWLGVTGSVLFYLGSRSRTSWPIHRCAFRLS